MRLRGNDGVYQGFAAEPAEIVNKLKADHEGHRHIRRGVQAEKKHLVLVR